MTKKKRASYHSSSPANRRESIPQQRVMPASASRQNKQQQRRRVRSRRSPWPYVIGTVVVIAILVVVFMVLSRQSSPAKQGQATTSTDKITFQEVTQVSPALLSQIGTGTLVAPFSTPSGSPPLLADSTGKPEVFYYGGEFCPYCAAERWGVVVALSQFGTFHTLDETTSSSTDVYPDTATFTFYKSSYSSSYVDFVPVEGTDRQQAALQPLTPNEQNLVSTYDTSGSIPFMDIGNKYLVTQPGYSPGVLRTDPQNTNSSPLSQQQIAGQLSSVNTISKGILGTANFMTAAICTLTNNRPSNVCSASYIQSIERSLKPTALVSPQLTGSLLTAFENHPVGDIRHTGLG